MEGGGCVCLCLASRVLCVRVCVRACVCVCVRVTRCLCGRELAQKKPWLSEALPELTSLSAQDIW